MSDRLRWEALDAQEKLEPFGVSITEVVAQYIQKQEEQSIVIDELVKTFIVSRHEKKRSDLHLRSLRNLFKRFLKSFSGQRSSDITTEAVEQWLNDLKVGSTSYNSYRRQLHSLFSYGVKRRLCPENPITFIETQKVIGEKVGIITVDDMRALLSASAGDVLATMALGAFAGIRPEEIARLTWEEIDLEQGLIDIDASKSKTAKQRYVKILPVLAAWIEPLKRKGSIQQENFRRRFDDARRKAGFATRGNARKLKGSQIIELTPWPHDGLRHSFASYHIALFEDAAALALQMGHQGNALIFSNYRHRVKSTEADAYFNLFPPTSDSCSDNQIPPTKKGDLPPKDATSVPPAAASDRTRSGVSGASGGSTSLGKTPSTRKASTLAPSARQLKKQKNQTKGKS